MRYSFILSLIFNRIILLIEIYDVRELENNYYVVGMFADSRANLNLKLKNSSIHYWSRRIGNLFKASRFN